MLGMTGYYAEAESAVEEPPMNKSPVRSASSPRKSRGSGKTVEDYLSAVPQPARTTLNKVRATIRSVVPKETEEVISYGMPAFKYKKVLVWYAAFAEHCSFFPTAAGIEQFKDELKGYKLSKGTIQFPIDKPLPAALVKKMVKARLDAIEGR
jgi:uncharacterized protein YdhG (YjbR/CyaY superfamily)